MTKDRSLARRCAKPWDWLLGATLAFCLLLSPTASAEPPASKVHRFVVIVGANDGGRDRVTLRYASVDAQRFGALTEQLGGVQPGDVIRALDSSPTTLESALANLKLRLAAARAPGVRTEVLFYYSGHSDESGLLLGGTRYEYQTLKARIGGLDADVKIAILDSCASGAFTRTKGGAKRPPFMVDESTQVTGYAFIASSSDTEAAQESDRIRASFFTHYLLSGLRGGADRNGDGKVTLSEAYEYASNETTTRTVSTHAGAQHPAYNMHLAGTGDVVMTDLRSTSASLVLDKQLDGRVFIWDGSGELVVELNKRRGKSVTLALPPSEYSVVVQRAAGKSRATVHLAFGQTTNLSPSTLEAFEGEPSALRGNDGLGGHDARRDNEVLPAAGGRVFAGGSVIPELGVPGRDTARNVSFNLLYGETAGLSGFELGIGNTEHGDAAGLQLAGAFNRVRGDAAGVQLTAGANLTRAASGVQLGAIANLNDAQLQGIQMTVGFNRTQSVVGAQVAAIANVAESVHGLQLGFVNVANGSVAGAQVGIVNIAEESDLTIGMFNFIRNGYRAIELSSSDTAPLQVGLKLGGRRFYSIVAISQGLSVPSNMGGLGFGIHTPWSGMWMDIDALVFFAEHISAWGLKPVSDETEVVSVLGKLRVALAWPVSENVALSGGAALNVGWLRDYGTSGPSLLPDSSQSEEGRMLTLGPGLFGGVAWTPDWLR